MRSAIGGAPGPRLPQHLETRQTCPSCAAFLTQDRIFPNYSLARISDEVHEAARRQERRPTAAEQLRELLYGSEVGELSAEDLTEAIRVLEERKRRIEVDDKSAALHLLLKFLEARLESEEGSLRGIDGALGVIGRDLANVMERLKEVRILKDREHSRAQELANAQRRLGVRALADRGGALDTAAAVAVSDGDQTRDARSAVLSESFEELEQHYDKLRLSSRGVQGWDAFSRIFCAHTRFAELRVVAEVDHCAFAPRGAVVSALDYNCTGRLLASGVCGVFQKVVLFDHRALCASVGAPGEDVAAVLDAGTKLSSLCWARADEGRLVTAEYAGGLALWDLGAGRQALRLGGHDKRVWSVDFSHHDANVLVTGSDDGTARVWDLRAPMAPQGQASVGANVLSVACSPGPAFRVAMGSASHSLRIADLRNLSVPELTHTLSGHSKAISYVRFPDPDHVLSASTDSTLKLWSLRSSECVRTYQGHKNTRNFVGLSVSASHIATGSEADEVVVYSHGVSKPMLRHGFKRPTAADAGSDVDDERPRARGASEPFVSAVAWWPGSQEWDQEAGYLAAINSTGLLRVLQLA